MGPLAPTPWLRGGILMRTVSAGGSGRASPRGRRRVPAAGGGAAGRLGGGGLRGVRSVPGVRSGRWQGCGRVEPGSPPRPLRRCPSDFLSTRAFLLPL